MQNPKSTKNLAEWLSYIESLHPKSIAMGLDRVKLVIDRLKLNPKFKIITVAGTNGKGSTCAMLERTYKNAGYQVACYTSPHFLRYNERVRVNGNEVSDDALCSAFSAVDEARQDYQQGHQNEITPLTYFEVGTLAAVWHFMHAKVDVAILEIGLGGRLDAVNVFNPDCAIVTSVDLDHQEFLGNTREAIGFEKAGVYRASVPAICGDANPPASLVTYAREIHADFQCIHQDFDFKKSENNTWQYSRAGKVIYQLPLPAMMGGYQLSNAACAVAAVESLQATLPVPEMAIATALQQVNLAGRFQLVSKSPDVILDVAHNPHAARALADNLKTNKKGGRTIAVFAMLADKDIGGVVDAVNRYVDAWYVASIEHPRGALAKDLVNLINAHIPNANVKTFNQVDIAYQQACIDASENDKILVFGSFFTVSEVMQRINDISKN